MNEPEPVTRHNIDSPGVTPLLRANGLSKSYAGVHALRDVSIALLAGEVHALVGENGAGKSTLIRILTGAVAPDSGEIDVAGVPVSVHDPLSASQRGIAAIYQQPTLFPHLTVAENLALGLERVSPWHRIEWPARRTRARDLLARVGARVDPESLASELSMAEQQLVEIARALGRDARIVIMDEPTASLTAQEVDRLLDTVRHLKARGAAVLYISHRLDEVFGLADRITVLRDGQRIDTGEANRFDRATLIRLMVGRDIAESLARVSRSAGSVVLETRALGLQAARIGGISLTVRGGEIVGLGGLVGAGRTELARILFGLTPADAGDILLNGTPLRIRRPLDAIRAGIAYVPEDRRRHGVIPQLRTVSNLSLASLPWLSAAFGWLKRGEERANASTWIERLDVRPPLLDAATGTLSGGNQQKVALGRWLMTSPRVLILDEPTQGVDVGAKREIHQQIVDLAAGGVAIVLISSDLPELIALSDRIVVMRAGRTVGTLESADISPEAVLRLALGEQAA
jgi:rhamnose transport system ATP-binding protein